MNQFAVLHSTKKHGQILIQKEPEDDLYSLKITFLSGIAVSTLKLTLKTEEAADSLLKYYEKEKNAVNTVEKIKRTNILN
ncbi:hypothetical protein [Riemerella columbina]|uniref:hypothetical protein n=1 Tax=Riemerella columbina TaxID=103810 RepID=UPI00036883FC|nr:hypothetical protein [Riemerella columbina]